MKHYNDIVATLLAKAASIPVAQALPLIEFPPKPEQGDRAIACFSFAKTLQKSPQEIAATWADRIRGQGLPDEIARVDVQGGYLNFFFSTPKFAQDLLTEVLSQKTSFAKTSIDPKQTAVIEYSSPNIAKPFSIGHLRSTNLGACLSRVYTYLGWNVQRINHLGDWGTQFGKLITAYRKWGNAQDFDQDPIDYLFKLYVQFHEEEKDNPQLTIEAREAFSMLEKGDENAKELWEWFRSLSLKELHALYSKLGVEFDHIWGESFYIDQLPTLLQTLHDKNLSKLDDGALIVDLKEQNLSVAVLQKGDESSLYITRDLAAAIYRFQEFAFTKMIYVVGSEQSLHFQQIFSILQLAGYDFYDRCQHVAFGQITFGNEKMSTRKGNVVFLKDVLARAEEKALSIVQEKNPDLEHPQVVAENVSLAAILFADISAKRIKNVKFDWDEILSFEGETGPYLQYSYARAQSLMKKWEQDLRPIEDFSVFTDPAELKLLKTASQYVFALEKVVQENEPFYLGKYLLDLTKDFNRFYQACRIVGEEAAIGNARASLVQATSYVLASGMSLLGIPTLEKM
ncbi:MAG: arginine--tRNA ligase [Bdellovibrionota bacterium]